MTYALFTTHRHDMGQKKLVYFVHLEPKMRILNIIYESNYTS